MNARAGRRLSKAMGQIYFIACGDRPFVKIGWAIDPEARLLKLQCGCPDELQLIGTVAGTMFEEMAWQQRFVANLFRGEWFHMTDELRAIRISTWKSNHE